MTEYHITGQYVSTDEEFSYFADYILTKDEVKCLYVGKGGLKNIAVETSEEFYERELAEILRTVSEIVTDVGVTTRLKDMAYTATLIGHGSQESLYNFLLDIAGGRYTDLKVDLGAPLSLLCLERGRPARIYLYQRTKVYHKRLV